MRRVGLLLACLCIAVALPAFAEDVQQVTTVPGSDVLNVRQAPSANAPIIGALSPLADAVIVRERRGDWARIEYSRGVSRPVRGWVEARFLEPANEGQGPDEGIWGCFGTEPFWNAWIENGQVYYRDDLDVSVTPIANLRRIGRAPSTMWTFTFGRGEDPTIAIMLAGHACSNGMSEETSRRTLLLTGPGGGVINGCCSRRPAEERPPPPEPQPEEPPQE